LALERLAHPAGITLGAKESAVYVSEMAANRVVRFAQRPAGVWHMTVFHQFAGRAGPTAVAWDDARGLLYVARYEFADLAEKGVISVLDGEGALVRELAVPGPEVTGLAITPDGTALVVSEATTSTLYRILL
jgi:DNA-binding beta-propeller fold protein YncE